MDGLNALPSLSDNAKLNLTNSVAFDIALKVEK